MPAEASKLEIKFLYGLCNDVAAMRRFYIELLGLRQIPTNPTWAAFK